jgi:hypothetical protein
MQYIGGRQTTGGSHGAAVDHRPSGEALSPGRFRSVPTDGDVVASKRTARADVYTISIVPDIGDTVVRRHSEAIDQVRKLAEQLGVDGWFTCNHTHFARVATHRSERSPTTVPTHGHDST